MSIPQPTPEVGMKLASLVMHADEAMSSDGRTVDIEVFKTCLKDDEVQSYLQELDALALLPLRRTA